VEGGGAERGHPAVTVRLPAVTVRLPGRLDPGIREERSATIVGHTSAEGCP